MLVLLLIIELSAKAEIMRWNEDVTMKFVKAYLKHQHLWDTRHPLHKHKFRRNKSLQSVLDEFRFLTGINIDTKEAKLKIKSLRSTYKQEINKILNRSMPEAPYTPSIKWFDEWHRCFKNLPTSRLRSSEVSAYIMYKITNVLNDPFY